MSIIATMYFGNIVDTITVHPNKITKPTIVDFKFPFAPYPIQRQLMEEMYQVLEEKKIGIFESPTGTGKSLTLTCAVLKWQEDHEQQVRDDLLQKIKETEKHVHELDSSAEERNEWLNKQYAASKEREELCKLRQILNSLQEHKQRLSERHERQVQYLKVKQRKFTEIGNVNNIATEMRGSDSDDDNADIKNDFQSKTVREEVKPMYREVQIFFCSRTHSQLTQVLAEVKRTAYGKRVRCISLASRQQLCINPYLKNLPSAVINERCLDMAGNHNSKILRESKKREEKHIEKCPYKKSRPMQHLEDALLTDVLDIEDIVSQGKEKHACPYYATRSAVADAQLVFMPYQMLLHKKTRQQLGINLQGSIVIIDEAHNLLSTLADLHSCTLSLAELQLAQAQIISYRQRYQNLLNAENLLRINQLLYVIKSLTSMFTIKSFNANNENNNRIFKTYELMSEADFFNISLFLLLDFCDSHRLAQKLHGFSTQISNENKIKNQETTSSFLKSIEKQQQFQASKAKKFTNSIKIKKAEESTNSNSLESPKSTSSALRPVLSLLEALTENAEDGRIIFNVDCHDASKCTYKYFLLNPGRHFESIAQAARSIIIAGGTMQPTTQITDQLFFETPSRVSLHIYDHVVPPEAVKCFIVKRGPCGQQLVFNFKQRNNFNMLSELGSILLNLCNVVPAGLVCFLPSYEYLDQVHRHLEKTCILDQLMVKKQILYETRLSGGDTVDTLLAKYKKAALSGSGALLFSVVGGKLSEGLNFIDDLGRGVLVVGMPYANRHTIELKQRMEYLENKIGIGQGEIYYENLCMKAVNQCIGRAVRHINDFACVFLLDERYAIARIQDKLPKWIKRSLKVGETFGQIYGATAKFFRDRKKNIL